jgi:hypothetical protein
LQRQQLSILRILSMGKPAGDARTRANHANAYRTLKGALENDEHGLLALTDVRR